MAECVFGVDRTGNRTDRSDARAMREGIKTTKSNGDIRGEEGVKK